MKASRLRLGMNLWPPFLFAGIRVVEISPDYRYARVEMRLRPWNRNFFGTHFGGSLFAMTDPFWVLLLFNQLGGEHVVWDQAGEIEFVAPGRGTVYAEFRLTDEHVEQVLDQTASGEKALVWFDTDVVGQDGTVIAKVRKQVYARRKRGKQLARA
jgi:acyl-coenzyme A thioesterase PaaI-like protein